MRYIELRLRDIKQLFHSMDPSPFREKDLDRDAEEFIVSWSHEIPADEPIGLRVHLDAKPAEWWPVRRQIRNCERLSKMKVEVV